MTATVTPTSGTDATDLKTNKMLVSVVLDRSGSMESSRAGTISGFNEYLTGLRADKDSEYDITLIQFNSAGNSSAPELMISYVDKPLAEVPALTADTYQPNGSTPLYDAIGECVRRVEAKNRAVTLVIITDGEENASREFTLNAITALLKEKEGEGWTIAFLAANIDAFAVGSSMGVQYTNTSNYAVGNEGVLYRNLVQSTVTRSHATASLGVRAASARPLFTKGQQAAMAGSGPGSRSSVPPSFRPAAKPPASQSTRPSAKPPAKPPARPNPKPAAPVARKQRDWRVSRGA